MPATCKPNGTIRWSDPHSCCYDEWHRDEFRGPQSVVAIRDRHCSLRLPLLLLLLSLDIPLSSLTNAETYPG